MSTHNILQELDDARLVRYDGDLGIVYAWFGGTVINVYSVEGACLDCWTMHGENFGPPTLAEVAAAIAERMQIDLTDGEAES